MRCFGLFFSDENSIFSPYEEDFGAEVEGAMAQALIETDTEGTDSEDGEEAGNGANWHDPANEESSVGQGC